LGKELLPLSHGLDQCFKLLFFACAWVKKI